MKVGRLSWILVAGAIAGLGACKKKPPPAPPARIVVPAPGDGANPSAPAGTAVATGDPREDARGVYAKRCLPCHGATGRGDGPEVGDLKPRPVDFTDAERQKKISDAQIEQIIRVGGAGVGRTPAMPPNPDLARRPGMVPALREMIRGFAKK